MLTPTIGEVGYSVGARRASQDARSFVRVRVTRLTPTQIIATDKVGREYRFYRDTGYRVTFGAMQTLQLDPPHGEGFVEIDG